MPGTSCTALLRPREYPLGVSNACLPQAMQTAFLAPFPSLRLASFHGPNRCPLAPERRTAVTSRALRIIAGVHHGFLVIVPLALRESCKSGRPTAEAPPRCHTSFEGDLAAND